MVDYKNDDALTMSRNYYRKLLQEIMTASISMTRKMWELQGYWRIQKLINTKTSKKMIN